MRRREFISSLCGAAAVCPLRAQAHQQRERVRRIGVLVPFSSEREFPVQDYLAAFKQGLRELGWIESSIRLEYRFAGQSQDRMRAAADDLIASKPDVIVVWANPAAAVLHERTKSIPIVFVTVSDAVGGGFVSNLAHPGGNITGFQNFEAGIGGKWVDLLREIAPHVLRVGFLYTPEIAAHALFMREIEESCSSSGVSAFAAGVQNASEIDPALSHFAREPNGGMIVAPSPLNTTNRRSIIQRATDLKIPTVYPFRYFCRDGGLASYGFEPAEQHRAAASYVSRILNGEKPGDLPVQAPSRYELVINLKAAKAIGLSISSGLQLLAAEVIE